jgi:CopG family nickel-responsive transcriptional regulator
MTSLSRFGMSLDAALLKQFDEMIVEKGYVNRSEAIRDLIRDALVQRQWQKEKGELVGTITLIYDHHVKELSDKMTALQHDYFRNIVSALHIHLDHDHCLEVLALKGKADQVRKIADELIGMRGVKHGKLVTTTTGKNLK